MIETPSSPSPNQMPSVPEELQAALSTRTKVFHALRAAVAVLSPLLASVPIGVGAYSAILPRIIPGLWPHVRNNYRKLGKLHTTWVRQLGLEGALQMRQEVEGEVPSFESHERAIYIANHPSINGMTVVPCFVTERFLPALIQVSKQENLWGPMAIPMIWPMVLMDLIILINRNRNKRESALRSLRKGADKLFTPGSGILVYPDKRRPTDERIEESHQESRWRDLIPDIDAWRSTLPPNVGGLHTLLQATDGTEPAPRVVDFTFSFDRRDQTLKDVPRLVGATQHLHVEEVTDEIPHDQEALGGWLIGRWRKKNARIAAWRGEEWEGNPVEF